jgi:plastocyanin domain-containing protein
MTKLVYLSLLLAACSKSQAPTPAAKAPYEIDVTEKGFEPDDLVVPAGKPVTLVFERKTDETCAKQIVLDPGDGHKIQKDLPLHTPVEIATTFAKPGKLSYACGMDMMKGTITVQ